MVTCNASVKSLNEAFDALEKCFPGSKRITSADDSCTKWLDENASLGGKAVEKGDRLVNKNGKLMEG